MFKKYNKSQVAGKSSQASMFILLVAVDSDNILYKMDASNIFDGIINFQIRLALKKFLEEPKKLFFNNLPAAIKAGNELVTNLKKNNTTSSFYSGSNKCQEEPAFQVLEVNCNKDTIKTYVSEFLNKNYQSLAIHSYYLYNPDETIADKNTAGSIRTSMKN
ncbi:hypothetical protein ACNVED_11110 [Legionella sp. D16C41]|uniref:hypothetical protein n=1 Tax=Legionella sp. D16C41 TaxID=3402688 RepID=UPI003AF63F17